MCSDGCEFGEDGAKTLSQWLGSQNDTLQHLHLNLNEMGDDGVGAIIATIGTATDSKIEELALEQNEIGEEGANSLVNASFPNLMKLRVADNEDLPKHQLKKRYGKVVDFGDDDDDNDDNDDEDNEEIDELACAFSASQI
jgi:hypothetical protein